MKDLNLCDKEIEVTRNDNAANFDEKSLYVVTTEQLEEWTMVSRLTLTLTTEFVGKSNEIEVSFSYDGIVINERISYDDNLNTTDNHVTAAIIGARLATRQDNKRAFKLTDNYSEHGNGYAFSIALNYR